MPHTDRDRRRYSLPRLCREADVYASTWIEQAAAKELAARSLGETGLIDRAEIEDARAACLRIAAKAVQDFARNGGKS